jgi:uncharacterized protein (DUF2236 family)
MASQLSDFPGLVGRLHESARDGDWQDAMELAALLAKQAVPGSRHELGEYLRGLRAALIAAKASRADAAASLARLNAAATFNSSAFDPAPERQEFGDSAEFQHMERQPIEPFQ